MAEISAVTLSLFVPSGKTHWVAVVHAKALGVHGASAQATGPTAAKAEAAAQAKATAKVRDQLKAKAKRDAKKRGK